MRGSAGQDGPDPTAILFGKLRRGPAPRFPDHELIVEALSGLAFFNEIDGFSGTLHFAARGALPPEALHELRSRAAVEIEGSALDEMRASIAAISARGPEQHGPSLIKQEKIRCFKPLYLVQRFTAADGEDYFALSATVDAIEEIAGDGGSWHLDTERERLYYLDRDHSLAGLFCSKPYRDSEIAAARLP